MSQWPQHPGSEQAGLPRRPPPLPQHRSAAQSSPMAVQPGVPMAQYAPAYGVQSPSATVWQSGRDLVMLKGASLPDRCVKCNQPAHGYRLRRALYWHHPAVYIAIISPLIYIILALVLRKSATVHIALCERHRRRRAMAIRIGWVLVVLGIAIPIVGASSNQLSSEFDVLLPLGILLALGGAIGGLIGARMITAQKIDDHYAWIRGACPEYLSELPSVYDAYVQQGCGPYAPHYTPPPPV